MDNEADSFLAPETVVGGGYRVIRHIARGGMGDTYEALQVRLGRRVCLKFIEAGRTDDPRMATYFEEEAVALARLAHPNIVTIFDYGHHDGVPYLVMEYVDGGSLDVVADGKPLEIPLFCSVMEAVGKALSYVHSHNIIHRDIKPGNVLLGENGDVKLADFGVAKIVSHELGATETGGIGTPAYCAPEVLQGRRYDHRADIYSLGVTAFILLTGRPPEQGDKPSQFNPALTEDVDVVLAKALAPRPSDRYEMVRSFVTDLIGALTSRQRIGTFDAAGSATVIDIGEQGTVLGMPDEQETVLGNPGDARPRTGASSSLPPPRPLPPRRASGVVPPIEVMTPAPLIQHKGDQKAAKPAPVRKSGNMRVLYLSLTLVIVLLAGLGVAWYFTLGTGAAEEEFVAATPMIGRDYPHPGIPTDYFVKMTLEPGEYQYRFYQGSGSWFLDYLTLDRAASSDGFDSSVVRVPGGAKSGTGERLPWPKVNDVTGEVTFRLAEVESAARVFVRGSWNNWAATEAQQFIPAGYREE